MLKNNNQEVIRRVTKRSLFSNRVRNAFAVLAIALTTFMIFSIFSIGISFNKNYEIGQIRMSGNTASVYLQSPTQQQYEQVLGLSYVAAAGESREAGTYSFVNGGGQKSELYLQYLDAQAWEKIYQPALSDLEGTYPLEADEIMLSVAALEQLGISEPQQGMEISLDETFRLSGWFRDYVSGAAQAQTFVSSAYCENKGYTQGILEISLKPNKNQTAYDRFLDDVEMQEGQDVIFGFNVADEAASNNLQVILLISLLALFIVFSGYLLIYNVMYISVTKDIRFYGMLKTIGTSPKQIRSIVRGQIFRLGLIGIPAGLLLGTLVSFGLVPYAITVVSNERTAMPTSISFHPLIFAATIGFSLFTLIISCHKPASMAGKVSPMEALKYQVAAKTGPDVRKSRNSGKISKMAFYNVFRDKKRALLVFLSLFLGTITILSVYGVLGSMDMDNFLDYYYPYDMELIDHSVELEDMEYTVLDQVAQLDGILELEVTRVEKVSLPFDRETLEPYLEFWHVMAGFNEDDQPIDYEVYIRQLEEQSQGRVESYVFSISEEVVEAYAIRTGKDVDLEAFRSGKAGFAAYSDYIENADQIAGSTYTVTGSTGETRELEMLGCFEFEDVRLAGFGGETGGPEMLLVSEQFIRELNQYAPIYKLSMNAHPETLNELTDQVVQLVDAAPPGVIDLSLREAIGDASKQSVQIMQTVGTGISLLLILVGLLNFVNVMLTGVYTRKQELAIMESVGMTKKQINRMLRLEGAYYAGITTILILTIGNILLMLIASWVPSLANYASFRYPAVIVAGLIAAIFAICLIVPESVYKISARETVTERLRSVDN